MRGKLGNKIHLCLRTILGFLEPPFLPAALKRRPQPVRNVWAFGLHVGSRAYGGGHASNAAGTHPTENRSLFHVSSFLLNAVRRIGVLRQQICLRLSVKLRPPKELARRNWNRRMANIVAIDNLVQAFNLFVFDKVLGGNLSPAKYVGGVSRIQWRDRLFLQCIPTSGGK
jgi:hypothetical protein